MVVFAMCMQIRCVNFMYVCRVAILSVRMMLISFMFLGGVCGVLLFVFLVCEMVKLPWLFGTVVVLFWKLVSVLCLLLCATVCEFTLRNFVSLWSVWII